MPLFSLRASNLSEYQHSLYAQRACSIYAAVASFCMHAGSKSDIDLPCQLICIEVSISGRELK